VLLFFLPRVYSYAIENLLLRRKTEFVRKSQAPLQVVKKTKWDNEDRRKPALGLHLGWDNSGI